MVIKLLATVHKELLLLFRDRAGLFLLFLMPAVLVLVISLVQENVLKTIEETNIKILFIDKDRKSFSKLIESRLIESGSVEIVKKIKGRYINEKLAIEALGKGDYQFCLVIPKGITNALKKVTRQRIKKLLSPEKAGKEKESKVPEIIIYMDPMVRGGFRSAFLSSLKNLMLTLEVKEDLNGLTEILPGHIKGILKESMGFFAPKGILKKDLLKDLKWSDDQILQVKEKTAFPGNMDKLPTSVQQNVPAWSLFGMFFIVLPLAGSLIKERQEGTFLRLKSLPVSYLLLISGKLIAYVTVCVAQFGLIVLMGKTILPLMGTPVLTMGSNAFAVIAVALSAALAATGYGIMIGTIAGTHDQASMFGAISVVIAAALGGIMVPVFAMPEPMQNISVFSPLAWAHRAFLEIFIRQGNLKTLYFDILLLFSFFTGTMLTSWFCNNWRTKR